MVAVIAVCVVVSTSAVCHLAWETFAKSDENDGTQTLMVPRVAPLKTTQG